jgi:UPF0716 protein FxsA
MPVFALLLAWPLIEIALFVTIGGAIGLWLTLLVVIGTGFLGVALLQRQGLRSAEAAQGLAAFARKQPAPWTLSGKDPA